MDFIRVRDADVAMIKEYTQNANTNNCEFSIANIFLWNDVNELHCAVIDHVLVYRLISNGTAIYSPVNLPEDVQHFVVTLEKDAHNSGCKLMLSNLSEADAHKIEKIYGDKFSYYFDRADTDYIYLVEDLINLSGTKYHSKKNNLNKFLKNNEFCYEEITKDSVEECLAMKNIWIEKKTNKEDYMEESVILDEAFCNYEKYNFVGGLIRIKGEVVAFTLGEKLSDEVFVTHFEKAYDDVPGLYQAINQQFAANTISKYKYVNREDDMGHEGLRKAKLSYKPVILLDKYIVCEKAKG